MPLYEYLCKKCEKKFETLVSFKNADDPVKCPECGSKETRKLLSTFAATVKNNSPSCSQSSSCRSAGT